MPVFGQAQWGHARAVRQNGAPARRQTCTETLEHCDRGARRAAPENVMPRKGPVPRREILPDPIYGSRLAARFVNRLMYNGKKGAAEKIFYGALEALAEKTGEEALRAFEKAVENVKPHLEVKARRVGGATYQVPMEVRPDRQISLSIRWLINYARSRGEKSMASKLAAELLDAFNNRGGAVKKKEDTHRMAEANKAFAHYRW